jgi:hypothetical protein
MASRKSLSALAASLMADFSSSIVNTPDVLLNGTRAAALSFTVSLSDAREE